MFASTRNIREIAGVLRRARDGKTADGDAVWITDRVDIFPMCMHNRWACQLSYGVGFGVSARTIPMAEVVIGLVPVETRHHVGELLPPHFRRSHCSRESRRDGRNAGPDVGMRRPVHGRPGVDDV